MIDYIRIKNHVGCHHYAEQPHNKGIIVDSNGKVKRPVPEIKNTCSDRSKCINIGRDACQEHNRNLPMNHQNRCIGFGLQKNWGVQLYNIKALDQSLCNGEIGLFKSNNKGKPNENWETHIQKEHYNVNKRYNLYRNNEIKGYNILPNPNSIYKKREGIDFPTCKYLCQQMKNCKIFTHYNDNTCWLKHGNNIISEENNILKKHNGSNTVTSYDYLKKSLIYLD